MQDIPERNNHVEHIIISEEAEQIDAPSAIRVSEAAAQQCGKPVVRSNGICEHIFSKVGRSSDKRCQQKQNKHTRRKDHEELESEGPLLSHMNAFPEQIDYCDTSYHGH